MASIKNRKSKSKGLYGVAGVAGSGYLDYSAYDFRRQEFTHQAPIIVRPLRTIKRWAQAAGRELNEKMTAMLTANPNATFTDIGQALREEFVEVRIRMARVQLAESYAAAGNGRVVRQLAATI